MYVSFHCTTEIVLCVHVMFVQLLSCWSICLVFPSVIFFHLSVLQAQEHMERYLLEEWTLRETDLLRERGLWGPPVGSRLRKWMLDMTEGTDCWISKINLIFCNLVDFMKSAVVFWVFLRRFFACPCGHYVLQAQVE